MQPSSVRTGSVQRFSLPEDVTLHCEDFVFEEHAAEVLAHGAAGTSTTPTTTTHNTTHITRCAWEEHYTTHSSKFYPIKNYLLRAFPTLCDAVSARTTPLLLLECGCGTGSALLPILHHSARLPPAQHHRYYGFDISPTAVREMQNHEVFISAKQHSEVGAFVWDFATEEVPEEMRELSNKVTHVVLTFVLSALHPKNMVKALERVVGLLAPGGVVCFRDYGVYDHSHLRFVSGKEGQGGVVLPDVAVTAPLAEERSCVRGDATLSYFFCTADIAFLAETLGLEVLNLDYHCAETTNRKTKVTIRKVFVNAVMQKPM